jgi:2-polyprenyl-3-methyl-5-hydroxy-6-metoxy-1,4-benzoquinol methylase
MKSMKSNTTGSRADSLARPSAEAGSGASVVSLRRVGRQRSRPDHANHFAPATDVECPLTGKRELEEVELVPVDELVWIYRTFAGVDVSSEFEVETIRLLRNPRVQFSFFHPIRPGSVRFYEELYDRRGYSVDKEEYRYAAALIEHGCRVLDVGCGTGLFFDHIPQSSYLGLEMNPRSVAIGRERGVDISEASVEELAEGTARYDVVTAFQVLEHVSDPMGFFGNCVRCIADGGRLIVSVPNAMGYMSRRENSYLNYPPHHVSWWTLKSFLFLARRFGLSIVDYHEDKLRSLSHYAEVVGKDRLNALFGRAPRRVRRGRVDRLVNQALYHAGRILPVPAHPIAPNGHSITVVFQKPSGPCENG